MVKARVVPLEGMLNVQQLLLKLIQLAQITAEYVEMLQFMKKIDLEVASEFRYRKTVVPPDTLFVTISQSGETADTLAAMELARSSGALLGTVCNVRGSSSWRLADACMLTQAGPEIGVASTKAFTTQLVALVVLALALRKSRGLADGLDRELLADLQRLPLAVEEVLRVDR